MELLYIIGNGFDIAQGSNTSYTEFYKYLDKKLSPRSRLLELMLNDINFKKELNWSDMELALGEFCVNANSKEEFDEFYFYLADQLKEFLVEKENQFSISDALMEKYASDLITPDFYLTNREKSACRGFFSTFTSQRNINVITYNYTTILEKALQKIAGGNKTLPTLSYSYAFQKILKIHGSLTSPMLMGLDNIEQIQNKEFAADEDIIDYFIKPVSNYQLGTLVDDNAQTAIEQANLIVTMGVSFGETDKTWWKHIGDRLNTSSKVRVIIYQYCQDIADNAYLKQRKKREITKIFLQKCGLSPEQIENCSTRVHVAINEAFLKPDDKVVGISRRGY